MRKRRILAVAMAVAMALSMSAVGAFADELGAGAYLYGTGVPPQIAFSNVNCSTYLNGTSGDSSATVTLIMEAGDAFSWNTYGTISNTGFREEITKTISTTDTDGLTVMDLLNAVNASHDGGLYFTITTSTSYPDGYLDVVQHYNSTWDSGMSAKWKATGDWGVDGWVFRVNDKFPVELTSDGAGYQGTSAEGTFLHDGDVVHFFYDAPSNFDDDNIPAANYVQARAVSRTSSYIRVRLWSHSTFINQSDWKMYVNKYANVPTGAGITAKLYDTNGNLLKTATSTSNGYVVFNGSYGAGTYIVKTISKPYVFTSGSSFETMLDNAFFKYTGAYNKITLS